MADRLVSVSAETHRAFSFVDLSGYTAATAAHGDQTAAYLSARLVRLAHACLTDDDEIVKSLGDAVFCVSKTATASVTWATQLLRQGAQEASFPWLRGGLTFGAAARRDHDYFGMNVNVASRLVDAAQGGQLLCTRPVAVAASWQGFVIASLGRRSLKNVPEPVPTFNIEVTAPERFSLDPVCLMRLDPTTTTETTNLDGRDYWFCSPRCRASFLSDPDVYAH